eukprot:8507993-Karenia_brevis.AAC.1
MEPLPTIWKVERKRWIQGDVQPRMGSRISMANEAPWQARRSHMDLQAWEGPQHPSQLTNLMKQKQKNGIK